MPPCQTLPIISTDTDTLISVPIPMFIRLSGHQNACVGGCVYVNVCACVCVCVCVCVREEGWGPKSLMEGEAVNLYVGWERKMLN